jgi:hypothetical protein
VLPAAHSSRGVLPSVCVIVKHRQRGGLGPLGLSHHGKKRICNPVMGTVIFESVL